MHGRSNIIYKGTSTIQHAVAYKKTKTSKFKGRAQTFDCKNGWNPPLVDI